MNPATFSSRRRCGTSPECVLACPGYLPQLSDLCAKRLAFASSKAKQAERFASHVTRPPTNNSPSPMGLVRSLPVSGLAGIFEGCGLGVDGSDFKQEAAFQTGVSFGDFRSFIEV